ncbi:aminomethyl-transferring glycine dehydrogenase subunit GcvPB [Haematospirillum sp. H1815]|uniref:aminomethyl-transferring glycine dehydrogenase subunit GcvPB n=1 Tax=Haematospirillum sp. H1815 TaxID=2723108 RepID=UPI00143BD2B2|nr:aminomethyl-transferring glycine dehydrogenase subunit GcvPB [Haematospirillum sp. H1815]NKD76898.1 aminomethyl-transferring glycine dehydrogenase subunit GcvPB [Haematospirillum sp. H1815]
MTTPSTFTGNKGLQTEERLIFEYEHAERTAVDLPPAPAHHPRLGSMRRTTKIGLPGLAEPQVVRHYTRLSQKNFGIDTGFFPLGSCTMKHNPRLNEKLARLSGLAAIHPFQPVSTSQGALALMDRLGSWLKELTGMAAVALSPAAGAHGELCGMMAIRAALDERQDSRRTVLVPQSAHGTNPATATLCGFRVEGIPAESSGRVSVKAVRERLGPHVAAIMITNPNTCGLFESEMAAIAEEVHRAGGFVYMDGANFNALVGRVRIADLGADAMHINLHKTFSTPHGGGGPGSGPTVLSEALARFAPVPYVKRYPEGFRLIETEDEARADGNNPFGRLKGYHGQFGMFVRAMAYMMSMGLDGLQQASGDAVLNANYLLAQLGDVLSAPFTEPVMHEVLFDDRFLKDTGISTLDFAKALIDEGFHPMTIYFPLVVQGALLIEPTETESKATLDAFIETVRSLVAAIRQGQTERFHKAPVYTPRRRLDETRAARTPVLRWSPHET